MDRGRNYRPDLRYRPGKNKLCRSRTRTAGGIRLGAVLAGVLMHGAAGQRLVVASSDSAPFNVEIACTEDEVNNLLEGFEPVPLV